MKLLIFLCFCALAAATPSSRIVGGEEADAGAWPWQVALFRYGKFRCGATIIGPKTAITAAHCLGGYNENFHVRAGTHRRNANCSANECIQQVVRNATIHPDYDSSGKLGYPNDIAVITWRDAIEEVEGLLNVKYINRTRRVDEIAKNCYITGWGKLSASVDSPLRLHEAKIDPITKARCLKDWKQINDGHLCLLDLHHMRTSGCSGDSGGPLVCEFSPGVWELAGVTSWGSATCDPTKPSVYSRISYFNDWIDSVVTSQ